MGTDGMQSSWTPLLEPARSLGVDTVLKGQKDPTHSTEPDASEYHKVVPEPREAASFYGHPGPKVAFSSQERAARRFSSPTCC